MSQRSCLTISLLWICYRDYSEVEEEDNKWIKMETDITLKLAIRLTPLLVQSWPVQPSMHVFLMKKGELVTRHLWQRLVSRENERISCGNPECLILRYPDIIGWEKVGTPQYT